MRSLLLISAAILAVLALRREDQVDSVYPLPSPHFTLAELTTTGTGLPNVPNASQKANLGRLAYEILEPLRNQFGPILITSGYRSSAVNKAVGGSNTSAHLDGRAADLYSMAGKKASTMAAWLYGQRLLPIRQIVVENHTGHLHLELQPAGQTPKRQFLFTDDGSTYQPWSLANV